MTFVGLHIHSDYSLLDGASQLPQLIEQAVKLGMPAIAVTDHGVMYGAIELIKQCRSRGIKPIIGNEMYVINGDITEQQRRRKKYHQVVLAKNTKGYKNLVKLTTLSHLKGFQGKGIFARPCINKELLEEYHEGLIVTSACLGGELPQAILQDRLDVAKRTAKWYQDVFRDDYYIEIQDHGYPEDRIVNVELVKIAREFGIKIVATNDSHFISCNDVEAHDALLCINTQKLITEEKRMRYSGTEYLKSAEEMAKLFRDHLPDDVIREAIATTLEVAEKVEPYTGILGVSRIPNYDIPPNHTPDTYLEEVTWQGLIERFQGQLNIKKRSEIPPVYKERIEYELKMMQKMGFSTYFLVVWDYIRYARKEGIPVGPGRGSAAGSLVAYALRITNIDPVHHGLLFERFLNPERKSMPDIDTDFCIARRDDMIRYVTREYGEDKVAQIITFNRMTSKAVLKDVGRVLGVPYSKADQMAKLIPVARGKPAKLKVMISDETPAPEFKTAYETEEVEIKNDRGDVAGKIKVREWIDMAIRIEGTNKTFGVHAAGVVISKEPLDEIVPLQRNNDGAVITQYFMEDIEALGLLKMDFLGLKNLTIIQKALDYVQASTNLKLDPYDLPAEERKTMAILARGTAKKMPKEIEKTYQLLAQGDLEGVFQLESSGMRQIVRELKPSSIEDISSILALYRPGPLDAGLIPMFINRKHGIEKINYDHQLLEPILNETYGVLVYQEQIMKMAQDLAGYSLGQADLLRRAMGKKKISEMQKHEETFIDGATKNGVTAQVAKHLYDQMVKFAEYCFNKSHSTAYGYVTYITAYLKANYPVEYMAALLTENSDNTDKVQKYIDSCQRGLKIKVVPPNVNQSDVDFTPVENEIIFGLSAIKNVGEAAIENILAARNKDGQFKDLPDFCSRVNLQIVNSRALESLVKCGAFDSLNKNRKQTIDYFSLLIPWAQGKAKDKAIGQGSIFDLLGGEDKKNSNEGAPVAPAADDFLNKEKLQFEKELLGFYVSEHPLKSVIESNLIEDTITLQDLEETKSKKVKVFVTVVEVKSHVTKKGDRMAFLQVEDLSGQAEAIVFPRTFQAVEDSLKEENVSLLITGKVDKQEDKIQIIIEETESVEKILERVKLKENQNENQNEKQENQQVVRLYLTPEEIEIVGSLEKLKAILNEYGGNPTHTKYPVEAIVSEQYLVKFNKQFWIEDREKVVERLQSSGFQASIFSNV
ncbi:MAG: DNA polymerase III subunit alpha [Cyanobacteria bacterium J06592_8]